MNAIAARSVSPFTIIAERVSNSTWVEGAPAGEHYSALVCVGRDSKRIIAHVSLEGLIDQIGQVGCDIVCRDVELLRLPPPASKNAHGETLAYDVHVSQRGTAGIKATEAQPGSALEEVDVHQVRYDRVLSHLPSMVPPTDVYLNPKVKREFEFGRLEIPIKVRAREVTSQEAAERCALEALAPYGTASLNGCTVLEVRAIREALLAARIQVDIKVAE